MKQADRKAETRTKLLDAAMTVIRTHGYTATTVDDICTAAGLTKGSFFHHFENKEALAVAAAEHFSQMADRLFGDAPFRHLSDPLDRVLGYIDFRIAILDGPLPDVTCLLGTLVQETYDSHPAIRAACDRYMRAHADGVARDLAAAKQQHAPDADWDPRSVGLYTQAALQGALLLAKAANDPKVAADCLGHLRRYVQSLFQPQPGARS